MLVSGSAIGYYGDRGDEELTEAARPGDDFLAEVCVAWEAATGLADGGRHPGGAHPHRDRASAEGGALAKQLLPFKLGLGGRAGDGPAVVAVDHARRRGAGHPVPARPRRARAGQPHRARTRCTNAEFAKTLGRVLHRPAFLPIPRFVTKLPLGVGAAGRHAAVHQRRACDPRCSTDAGFTLPPPAPGGRALRVASLGRGHRGLTAAGRGHFGGIRMPPSMRMVSAFR